MLSFITYMCGFAILFQLFNLQIVNGSVYRENSNTRLSRETTIQATRGSILDRNGVPLVSSDMAFSLEMYKSKADDASINHSVSVMTSILESNGDKYVDKFPININPFEYDFSSEEKLKEWKEKYNIPETASAEEAFYLFRDKYNIESEDVAEIRRILAIRYAISTTGYSATQSIEISSTISRNSAIQLQEHSLELTGVNVVTESNRIYYMGNLASHVIGYMGRISESDLSRMEKEGDSYSYESDDKIGKAGIERVFEKYLRGQDGIKQIDMDVNGTITGEYVTQEAIGGSDIVLTIDANLQRVAEQSLATCIENIRNGSYGKVYDVKGGSVVVVNVNNGEVLAMASNPDYTPQVLYDGISNAQYTDYQNRKVWSNKAIQSSNAPGSTFKMITAIAGLETGQITPTERINDTGIYRFTDDYQPKCWYYTSYGRGHGPVNVKDAIKKSCNFFFYDVGVRVGIDNIERYARFFGLGSKTGIELTGEVTGTVASKSVEEAKGRKWNAGSTLSAAIGQSYNDFTPIQMSKYIAMIANGGKNIDITIVKDIMNSDGTTETREKLNSFVNGELNLNDNTQNEVSSVNAETLEIVREGMRSVAMDEGGTAYTVFKNFNIEIGGKTGSAEAGANNSIVNAWFVGFAPYENPEIAVIVMVENGGHGYYTADVVKAVVDEYFGANKADVVEDMSVRTEDESFN